MPIQVLKKKSEKQLFIRGYMFWSLVIGFDLLVLERQARIKGFVKIKNMVDLGIWLDMSLNSISM